MTAGVDGRRRFGGRYRIDGSLGRGGMSEVFHGYDERSDRRVAIKVLRQPQGPIPATADSPEAVEILDSLERDRTRFLREIRTTARLELSGAPAVYDTGVETGLDGSPQLWLVMQLLRGSTLDAVLDRADFESAPPTVTWAAAIGAQVAAVLSDVHRVDVVHRDIKPANVMIIDEGLVKVLDFGIAILRGAGALPRLTQIDRTLGTPPYMSPEQCLGNVVTAASDVYSLGCLMVELLTGDPPFQGSADVSLRAHHLQSAAPSLHGRRPGIPEQIGTVVSAMLAKSAPDRPSAEAVYEALVPFATAAAGDLSDSRDPIRPFRRPLLPPSSRGGEEPEQRTPVTEAEFEEISAAAERHLENDRPAEAIRLLEDGVERAGRDPFVDLRLRHFLAAAHYQAGEFSRAAPLFDVVGGDYRQRMDASSPEVLDCSFHAGHAFAAIGKPDQALRHLRFYLHHAGSDDPETLVGTLFVLAQMLVAAGRRDQAVDELRSVRPLLVATFGEGTTQVQNLDRHLSRLAAEPY